jgi:hypothetical protein
MSSDPLHNTLLKPLWQRLQPRVFLGMTLQAWHTCIWGVSQSSLQILSSCSVGWGALLHSCFQVSPEVFDRVQVRTLAGPLTDIQRLVPKPLLHDLGCVLRVVVLLESEPSPQSEDLSALEQVFIQDLSVVCSVHLSPQS